MSTVESLQSEIATIDDRIARLRAAKEKLPEESLNWKAVCWDIFGSDEMLVGRDLLSTIAFAYRVVPEGWNIIVERNGYCRITDGNWIYSDGFGNNPAAALAMCLCDWKLTELLERRSRLNAQLWAREDEIAARKEAELARPHLRRFVMLSAPVIAAWLLFFDALR
jgi:hypothetical protein